jgi:ABC-2 type transport system permease protein
MITRIGAICGKEFRQLIRDPRILAMVILMPVIQLLLFAYAISFDVRNVPTFVIDNDRSQASRDYLASLSAADTFVIVGTGDSITDADTAFEFGRAKMAVLIPAGFGAQLARGEAGQLGILVDGTEPNNARIIRAASIAMNSRYSIELTTEWAAEHGVSPDQGQLEPRVRVWYNPGMDSSIFLIPGLMVVILLIVTVQQTAQSLVRERDLGTAEQLTVSPLRHVELIIGKLLPWTLIAFFDLAVITGLGVTVFGVPFRGDPLALVAGAAAFILAGLGIGLAISAVAPSVDTANIAALGIAFLPAFLLSGFVFPLDQIPFWLEWLSRIFPGRYMVTIAREVFLKGGGFAQIWPELGALCLLATALVGLSVILYARRKQ